MDRSAQRRPLLRSILSKIAWAIGFVNLVLMSTWALVTFVVPMPGARAVAGPKAAYVGSWKAGSITLGIDRDASVQYTRCDGSCIHYGGTILWFDGDDFTIGVFPGVPARFRVSTPPRAVDGRREMTVDGVTLTSAL